MLFHKLTEKLRQVHLVRNKRSHRNDQVQVLQQQVHGIFGQHLNVILDDRGQKLDFDSPEAAAKTFRCSSTQAKILDHLV